MLSCSITLLGWHRSFVGKKSKKRLGRQLCCDYFGQFGNKEIEDYLRMKNNPFKD